MKQQEPQPKPQVEQEKAPQLQVKMNHDDQVDNLNMMKKKTRRGGKTRTRHPTHIQDAKMLSKKKIQEKNPHAHIKCHSCATLGHLASGCPSKLEKKTQANNEKQGNEKHQMSKEEKAQQKRRCYLCREIYLGISRVGFGSGRKKPGRKTHGPSPPVARRKP